MGCEKYKQVGPCLTEDKQAIERYLGLQEKKTKREMVL